MKSINYFDNTNLPNKFDKFVFWACIIDTLFLPSVWFIAIPYTMPLIFYWAIKRHRYMTKNKEYRMFLIMMALMLLSTILGFYIAPEYLYPNITYILLFCAMFLYFFMFSNYINRNNFSVKKLLLIYIIFIVLLAILFNIDKSLYQAIKIIWNSRSGININESTYESFKGYRFSFTFWDPNNIAYLMNAIVLYLWSNEKSSIFVKIMSLFALLFVLVSCMSNGGFTIFIISSIIFILLRIISLLKGQITLRVTHLSIFMFIITLGLIIYIVPKIPIFLKSDVATESMDRMENNSADPRFKIWTEVVENTNFIEYILIGKGGVTLLKGSKFSPHNGHFYWILGYGFISYYIFMYIFFRKRRITPLYKYVWIIPILFGFTINIMLGEIKLMSISLLLVACSSSPLYLYNSQMKTSLKK